MKRIILTVLIAAMLFVLSACVQYISPEPAPSPSNMPTAEPASDPTPASTPIPSLTPTTSPATPTPFGEVPDSAGSGDVLFDTYTSRAEADIDNDGVLDQIAFTAGDPTSTVTINGTPYIVDKPNLAQMFAITDVNTTDGILELAFTEPYAELADSERAFTWLYWWDGTQIIRMGGLLDVKFHGAWRAAFDPTQHFDGAGVVTCLTRTEHFSDVWYMGQYYPNGTQRKLKEDDYVAHIVGHQPPLTLKEYCVLLDEIDSSHFEPDSYVLWDYASFTATVGRNYSDPPISFIPQAGESLTIVRVYGKNWFQLEASDGKRGWLKCVDKKIQGYWQVMGVDAYDIFGGIVIAG